MPIKWTVDDFSYDAGANNTNDVPIFRYAEVLLNLAEAKAELGTITPADWVNTVGALRARAGITGGLSTLPATADQYLRTTYFPDISSAVILEVRRERGIELALEGLRFQDLIRWKHGELMAMPWRGFYVPSANQFLDLNEDGTPDVYFYTCTAPASQTAGVLYINVSGGTQQRSLQLGDHGDLRVVDERPAHLERQHVSLSHLIATDLAVNPKLGQNPGLVKDAREARGAPGSLRRAFSVLVFADIHSTNRDRAPAIPVTHPAASSNRE